MAIRSACYVACDACGDPEEATTTGAADARAIARSRGWRRVTVDGKAVDVCPRCYDAASTPEHLAAAVRTWGA